MFFVASGIYLLAKHNWRKRFFSDFFAILGIICLQIAAVIFINTVNIFAFGLFMDGPPAGFDWEFGDFSSPWLFYSITLAGSGIYFLAEYPWKKRFFRGLFMFLGIICILMGIAVFVPGFYNLVLFLNVVIAYLYH